MYRGQEFLLLTLDVLLSSLIEKLNTLLHLLKLLLADLLDSISHSSLLCLVVLQFLLDLLLHRSQLAFVLRIYGIHFQFHLRYFRHLRKELLGVDVTEFLCAGNHRQSQQYCDNNLFHFL